MIVANLKMNLNLEEVFNYKKEMEKNKYKDLIVCFSNIYLTNAKSNNYILGAQNGYYIDYGAYTGEVSFAQLKELGVEYCIIGHSERRFNFFEDDYLIHEKVKACLKNKIIPIVCIIDKDESNDILKVLEEQLSIILNGIDYKDVIIAYEPSSMIGSKDTLGKTEIEKIYKFLKNKYNTTILYGGGVNETNIKEVYDCVDGLLIGTASKNPNNLLKTLDVIVK